MPETADDQMLAAIHNAAASLHLQVVPEQVCHQHSLSVSLLSLARLQYSISWLTLHSLGRNGLKAGILYQCMSWQMAPSFRVLATTDE